MKRQTFILALCAAPLLMQAQVTIQKGAGLHLQENAVMSIQDDIEAADNIDGEGAIILAGDRKQTISFGGNTTTSLVIDNSRGVDLLSSLAINKQLVLEAGHLTLGRNNLELGSDATVSGSASAYIVTDGAGKVIKSIRSDLSGLMLPLGSASGYSPLLLKSSGNYHAANVEIAALSKVNPNKPASSRDYLNNYWTVNRRGISGELVATAFYGQVTGEEENIRPYFWNGHQWISKDAPVDTRNKLLTVDIPEGSGEIYAMRKGDELMPAASSITVLPNPVHNTATVIIRSPMDETVSLRIIDNAGTTVMTERVILRKGVNQLNLNVTTLAHGHYTISTTMKSSRVVKMIKQ